MDLELGALPAGITEGNRQRKVALSLLLLTCIGLLFNIANRPNLLSTKEVLPVLFLFYSVGDAIRRGPVEEGLSEQVESSGFECSSRTPMILCGCRGGVAPAAAPKAGPLRLRHRYPFLVHAPRIGGCQEELSTLPKAELLTLPRHHYPVYNSRLLKGGLGSFESGIRSESLNRLLQIACDEGMISNRAVGSWTAARCHDAAGASWAES